MRLTPGFAFAALVAAFVLLRPGSAAARNAASTDDGNDTSIAPRESDNNPAIVEDFPVSLDASKSVSVVGIPAAVSAFLYMIRCSEHVYPRDIEGDDCYSIFYGGARFSDLSEHPVITGEMRPVPLPDHICAGAGRKPGCVSTAAGAYQIIKPTWIRARDALGLRDFSQESQDAAAVWLLEECGAMERIGLDDIQGAISRASTVWASLPGSLARQNPKKLDYALARYEEGLTHA